MPAHVENLASLALLDAQGFEGVDASLEISLAEYGLAWRPLPESGEVLFVHRHPYVTGRFERTRLAADTDPRREWGWVDWPRFLETCGAEAAEWDALPLTQRVFDLVNYYGPLEIFGGPYAPGFTVAGLAGE